MAIVPMEKIRLTAMKKNRRAILQLLQRQGVVEVCDIAAGEAFYKKDTAAAKARFEKNAEVAQDAVAVMDKLVAYKGPSLAFLRGREAVTPQFNEDFYKRDEKMLHIAQRILQCERTIAEAEADILRAKIRLENVRPWLDLPVSQLFTGTKKTAVFIGQIEGDYSLHSLLEKLAAAAPELDPVHVEMMYTSKQLSCFYVIVLKKDARAAEEALRAIGFLKPPTPTHHLPKTKQTLMEERIEKNKAVIQKAEDEIKSYADQRADLVYLGDQMIMRAEKYDVMHRLAQTKHVFVLEGYVPAPKAPALLDKLNQKFDGYAETIAIQPDEDVPVVLKNNWFAEPTEQVLESYSLPGKEDVDPTSVMAIFYYAMFGLMFGDAGYGIIMALVCGIILLKFKNMEPNWNKNIRLFFWCGIFTTFWGVIFSSYFGDVVNVVSRTFFGREVGIPPVWFYIDQEPMLMLVFSLGLGILHLTAGYIMKGFTNAKNGDKAGILYDTVFPILAWYPLVLILMGSDLFYNLAGFRLALPAIVTPICLGLTGIALLGILFTGGRESKRWPIRLMKGGYAIYNTLSGWLSDMLSYSRLLALGLASGVIASVMNQLGAMGGSGPVGVIMFVLVFLVGQGMNFGINVLGAYVHSNRLEYIEFFGKFYEGGGRKFAPFAVNTKHYKIIEEELHNDG